MKYKHDKMNGAEVNKVNLLEAIANEIAEQNRLTRISLSNSFIQVAASQLFKDGETPTEEKQNEYDQTLARIEFIFNDHLGKIDEEILKQIQQEEKKEGDQVDS